MKLRALFICCALVVVLPEAGAQESAQQPDSHPSDTPEGPQEAFRQLESAEDWRQAKSAMDRLRTMGEEAFRVVLRGAEDHEDDKVREQCYDILRDTFADRERVREAIANHGLEDANPRVQYTSAFFLGEQKVYSAHRLLRAVMERDEVSDLTRYTAAKSLGELGELDVIKVLYEGLGNDSIMIRYVSGRGVKGLTGRDLTDFGYDYLEGGMLSGGEELRTTGQPVRDAENRAKRFEAIAAFGRWLREARPDIYKHLASGF